MSKEQRHEPDFALFLTTLLLLGIGLVMVFSASYIIAGETWGDPYHFLKRQSAWIVLGLAGMFLFSRFAYWRLRRLSLLLILLNFLFLAAVFIPGIGVEINEARRWLDIGPFTMQPSEFSKLALAVFAAAYLSSRSVRMDKFWSSSFVPLLPLGLTFMLILLQPDLGTAVVIAAGTAVIILLAGMPVKHALGLSAVGLPLLAALTAKEDYRVQRLVSFMDPWADPSGAGYQIIQSLFALGPGHIFGVGLGRSRQKLYYLPEPHNDFIFAVIGEELGFIGAVTVLLLFFILVWRGIKIAIMAPDAFGSLLAAGVTAMLGIQALVNIAVVTGSVPVTGINLPLISAGGSSVFFTLCGIGILLNISRYTTK